MKSKITGFDYLWCALYACAGVAFELLVMVVENALGINTNSFTVIESIAHFSITTIGWVLIGFLVIFVGKRTTGFSVWQEKTPMKKWQWLLVIICFIVNIIAKYLDWGGFKVILEYQSKIPILFIFQYIYYLAEGFLISLIIVFGQKACEKWFDNDLIPYGGIILGLTWGLAHTFTQNSLFVGILSALSGFLFGAVYLFVNKDYRKALPIIILLFIL